MKTPRILPIALAVLAMAASVAACSEDEQSGEVNIEATNVEAAGDDAESEFEEIQGEVGDAIEEAGEDTVELAVRNLATIHAKDEFRDAGHPIAGELQCTADASDALDTVEVACVGQTEAGQPASLSGSTRELPGESLTELEGDFVGFVGGDEVFQTDALG
jgi:hypothetical protein